MKSALVGSLRGVLLLGLYLVAVLLLLITAYRQLATAAGSDRKTAKGMLLLTLAIIFTIWLVS